MNYIFPSQHAVLQKILEAGAVYAAKNLLGWKLYVNEADGSLTGGTISETEAYTSQDAASHSFRGETKSNSMMFQEAGKIYVYFTYGMHWCMNIVTGKKAIGEAVLIRSLQPDKGIDIMTQRRSGKPKHLLTNGPAKLCQALGINNEFNGISVNSSQLILIPPSKKIFTIQTSTRIGISKDKDRLWRFSIEE